MEFKLVINNKGRAGSKEIKDTECNVLLNKKVGDSVSGNTFGFSCFGMRIIFYC